MTIDLSPGHLSLDALVAYVDGQLSPTSFRHACAHLSRCAACAAEVSEQLAARALLRHTGCPPAPADLLDRLRAIPVSEG